MNKIFLLLVVLLLGMGGVGVADEYPDERPLSPDYSKLYYLGCTPQQSSSPCIGNPVTPECAVETHEGCLHQQDKNICRAAKRELFKEKYVCDNKRTKIIYKFVSKRELKQADIPQNYQTKWQAGDILIFMAWQVCFRYDHCFANLPDRSDPKGLCLPLDCNASGYDVHEGGKHSPAMFILRENEDGKWFVVEHITSSQFDRMKNRPEKLFQEGLAQMPW